MTILDQARHRVAPLGLQALRAPAGPLLQPLLLVAAATAGLVLLTRIVQLHHVSMLYMVPVLVAAIRWGTMPAIVAAVGGVAASAFFFYPPILDLRVSNPQHIADLALFIGVAIVTSQLAERVRAHTSAVEKRELEVRSLYAFSRRLAAASALAEILSAMRDHLSAVVGRRVFLFQAPDARGSAAPWQELDGLPAEARAAIARGGPLGGRESVCVDEASGAAWLVCAVSERNPALGMIAVDMGPQAGAPASDLSERIHSALADAAATLERLDVAHAIDEARARSSREAFREALIGSVSHELRSPLAAILGAATVLSQTQAAAQDERTRDLAHTIRIEAERLDSDIRNLLDASRISSAGLQARLAWTEPADLVNAAVDWLRARHPGRAVRADVSDELALVHVDPVLVEQALRQVLDNAVKYSPPGTAVAVTAEDRGGRIAIAVSDAGVGLTAEEREQAFERFYRGPRQQAAVAGSGLGLWIARAFVAASGGALQADSAGPGRGTLVTMTLPAPPAAGREAGGDADE
jgi:two-component system sensor histidine kinase KdpD